MSTVTAVEAVPVLARDEAIAVATGIATELAATSLEHGTPPPDHGQL